MSKHDFIAEEFAGRLALVRAAIGDAGWSFIREREYTDNGVNYGARVACYGRGNDRANVDSPGARGSYTYSFSIAWEIGRQPLC